MNAIKDLLTQLSVEEKAALLEGLDSWKSNPVPRLGIPSMFLTDGPHGLRKVRDPGSGFSIADNIHSTAFPTSATVASSWNPENAFRMGQAIADECLAEGVGVLLAPGVNIKRSPLCGRNFEYYSEDPLVAGVFGEQFVKGVQSRGVGCSVKHFAANSNEDFRFNGNSVVDERSLREIYLRAFERIIKEAKPHTVMCSYNRVNGTYASQNSWLLSKVLREDWGYAGLVMTDWGATQDRVAAIAAGCDLDMPGGVWHNRQAIIDAANNGSLSAEVLKRSVARMLELVEKCAPELRAQTLQVQPSPVDLEAQARISCDIAKDGAVLLKNDGVLPLSPRDKVLVIGEMFEKMRFQGAGSSLINPFEVVTPRDAFDKRGVAYEYKKGYRCFYTKRDRSLEREALAAASGAETVLFFGGLTDFEESEGFDRKNMRMGENQGELIERLIAAGKKVVLVLFTGSPVELPFFDGLSALLDMYLPGMHGGEATAALLFGDVSPSGKLAESWPLRAEDSSCFADYNRGPIARYYESIYVGYRFYDKAKTKLRFPFGHGLSYSSFEYSGMSHRVQKGKVVVDAEIRNTGPCDAAEVVQLYVTNAESKVFKAEKELRAFAKIHLKAGEAKRVSLSFEISDLSYWNIQEAAWVLDNGEYELCLAASAQDIKLRSKLWVDDATEPASPYLPAVQAGYEEPPLSVPECFEGLFGKGTDSFGEAVGNISSRDSRRAEITIETALRDLKRSFFGRLLYGAISNFALKEYRAALRMPDSIERDTRLKNSHFMVRMTPSFSLRSLAMASNGQFRYNMALAFAEIAKGHLLRGIKILSQKENPLPLPRDGQKEVSKNVF